MRRAARKASLSLIIALFSPAAFCARPLVVYGGDDRVEYYDVTESAWRRRADSTVALFWESKLVPDGDLVRITSTPLGPTNSLCPTERFYNQGKAARCSGFLVAPDTVVTAGHCISSQAACEQTRFVFGYRYDSESSEPSAVPAEHVFACRTLVKSITKIYGEDFAVVKLDRAVTHTAPLEFRRTGRPGFGDALTIMGHPGGIPLKVAGGAVVRSVAADFMVTNLDSFAQNSGSAVFNSVTGEVEGILVRGESDYELRDGCYVTKRCDPTMCRGEDVTLFERVLPFLGP